jgi:hypothetical protein
MVAAEVFSVASEIPHAAGASKPLGALTRNRTDTDGLDRGTDR